MISRNSLRRTLTSLASLAAVALVLLLAGCGGGGGSGPGAGGGTSGQAFSGGVYGGGPQNPVSGATVTLYAAGASGYGTGATSLTSATSNNSGSFTFGSYTCPSGNPPTYVVATGGDAGSGTNTGIGMMSLTGPCNSLTPSTFVTVNELTTMAAEWTLAQFTGSDGQTVGTSTTNSTGLTNAVNAAESNLVVSYLTSGGSPSNTGVPASFLSSLSCPNPPASGQPANCDALDRLDTLANIIASCINTSGPSSTQCNTLFLNTGGSTTTLQAAHAIATYPYYAVSAIFGIQGMSSVALLTPHLSAAPSDWTLALNFAPGGANLSQPIAVAIDASGNVWVPNYGSNSVSKLNPSGRLAANYNPNGANFSAPHGIAIDSWGNVWVPNFFSGSVTELTSSGALVGNFFPPGANSSLPYAVAIDASDNVWLSNWSNVIEPDQGGSVSELLAGCTSTSCPGNNFAPSGANFNEPVGVAIDRWGDVWVPNWVGNSVTALDPNGDLFGNFSNTNTTGANFSRPSAVAIDASGNVWVPNASGNSVSELGSPPWTGANYDNVTGAKFAGPVGVAIDASNNVWVPNASGNSVSELVAWSNYTMGLNFAPSGANFSYPYGVAIDASGNIWVPNWSGNSVGELVGLATPVLTPLMASFGFCGQAVCLP